MKLRVLTEETAPIQPDTGSFLVWLRVGRITEMDRKTLTFYTCTNGDNAGFFGSDSLLNRIKYGEVLIEQPERLLEMIAEGYEAQSNKEKASIVREALSNLLAHNVGEPN